MTPLLWTGIACAAALALLALWVWLWPSWQIRPQDLIDAEQRRRAEWADEIGDPARAQIDQALDVIAEPDRRRAEHMNRTLRRITEED